jgi:uncharacterized protein (TIGR02231 family)
MNRRRSQALACATALLIGAPLASRAQDVSRIVAATVYESSAVVERQLRTPGGTRHIQVACMPPGFTATTLQIDGDPTLHVGDVRTEPASGDEAQACAHGPADARLRALADQKSALKSQSQADDMALDYLRRWNGGSDASGHGAGAPPAAPAAEGLRKSAVELMADQARIAHQVADLDRQAAELQKSTRQVGSKAPWTTLRFDLSTTGPATLRVRYKVQGVRWETIYRAALDTATSTLRLERQAEISQTTGEDWTDATLTLSMGYVSQLSHPKSPDTWTLSTWREPRSDAGSLSMDKRAVQRVEVTGSRIDPFTLLPESRDAVPALDTKPVVGMQVEEHDWETLFHSTQPVTVPSDGHSHMLALDTLAVPVQVRMQVVPLQNPAAYALADAPAPAGRWAQGRVQVWRDGSLIGEEAEWSPQDDDNRLSLYFGRDDRVRVSVQRPPAMTAATGLFGSGMRRSWGSVFVVTNAHSTAQTVELLDAAPVSQDETVKVTSRYEPAPTTTDWQHRSGVNAWVFKLAPDQSQRVSISQQVDAPKDVMIRNLPTPAAP